MSEIFNFNRIGKDGLLTGNVHWKGDSYVGGEIKGNIYVEGGTLYVEESGVIHGDIKVSTAIIRGTVHGNIEAKDRLIIQSPALIKGKIISGKLSVFPGAQLFINAHVDTL